MDKIPIFRTSEDLGLVSRAIRVRMQFWNSLERLLSPCPPARGAPSIFPSRLRGLCDRILMIKKPFYSIFQGEFNDYAFDVDCNQQSECCRTLPVDYNQHRMHF